jgi:hypothetical protein
VLRKTGSGWQLEGEFETCDRLVAVLVSGDDLWAVGERHITRVRADAGGARITDVFDLYFDSLDSGEFFARRLAPDSCDGSEAFGSVVSAAARGRVLVLGLEDRVVLLDATRPSGLPTVGSAPIGNHLREVATDGRFVYAHGHGPEQWQAWRIGPTAALVPLYVEPARAFALGQSVGQRYATRLTGTALHLAWW